MQITFVTDMDETYTVEIDPDMKLQDVQALLEAESGIPISEQVISQDGRELNQPSSTMMGLGVSENAMLLLGRRVMAPGRGCVFMRCSHTSVAHAFPRRASMSILLHPPRIDVLCRPNPSLANAAESSPQRFAALLRQLQERQGEIELARQREIEALNAEPFDVEAQTRIEEAIRQQAIMENLEHALEYSPEAFGRVTMLYVPVEVNSRPVK
ncbi:hypothetical protein EV363DRAFT_1069030, partial [Boletus edulis]